MSEIVKESRYDSDLLSEDQNYIANILSALNINSNDFFLLNDKNEESFITIYMMILNKFLENVCHDHEFRKLDPFNDPEIINEKYFVNIEHEIWKKI